MNFLNKKFTRVSIILFVIIVLNSYVQGRISNSPIGVVFTIIEAIVLGTFMFKTIIKAVQKGDNSQSNSKKM